MLVPAILYLSILIVSTILLHQHQILPSMIFRKWLSPLDRRELTLLLLSLTIFTLSYNLDASLRILGLDPLTAEGAFQNVALSKFGFGGASKIIGQDGR